MQICRNSMKTATKDSYWALPLTFEMKMKFAWKDQKVLSYCELGAQSLYRSFIHLYDQKLTLL